MKIEVVNVIFELDRGAVVVYRLLKVMLQGSVSVAVGFTARVDNSPAYW